MKNPVWSKAVKASADPQRSAKYLELWPGTEGVSSSGYPDPDQARILCALFSGSQSLSNWVIAHPADIENLRTELLKHPRLAQGLRREVSEWLKLVLESGDFAEGFAKLRQFKQREMLRIAARDLARLADVTEIIRELSDVADVCLDAVWRLCWRQLTARLGQPYHQDAEGRWQPTAFCVLGMGKLGGQELNYSSDVDLLFLYGEEGKVFKEKPTSVKTPASNLSNHQFFTRLAEQFIAEVGRLTGDGTLYRIDMRLRPEGDAGPLARSLASYENYYAQWGQTWERMMLIKARRVAGDAVLANEFLEMIQPFRYPRSMGENVLREVAAMKDRIENEVVKAGELDRNVKLGRGGIREIEFIAQSLQLLHAGRQPFLQGPQTLPTLEKLREYQLLPATETIPLAEAYRFLRDVEHRLQMEDNRQTHTIPTGRVERERLARLTGFPKLDGFEPALKKHTQAVRKVFDRLLRPEGTEPAKTTLPRQFEGAEAEWKRILAEHGFKNVEQSIRMLNEFAHGPGYVHVSNRTVDLAWELLGKFLEICPRGEDITRKARGSARPTGVGRVPSPNYSKEKTGTAPSPQPSPPMGAREKKSDALKPINTSPVLSDPDRVLTRLDSFVASYGARATLFEIWNSNASLFTLLLWLFDRSEFLAEAAIRTPDLVDELVSSGRLRKRKNAAEILEDLRHGRDDADQRLWLRKYHQAELMRIGLRDILGLADFEQNLTELSALADACLQYAVEVVLRKNKLKHAPFVIIGLGKLGGAEINYGSDLDIMFVTGAKAGELPKLQRLAVEVMDLLSSRTDLGVAFLTDARLRPDGEKGLLLNTLNAYEAYYRNRAQLWEIQSLSRTRAVAGKMELGERFQKLAQVLTDFTPGNVAANFVKREMGPTSLGVPPSGGPRKKINRGGRLKAKQQTGLTAYSPEWKKQIHHMRQRIERERTPRGKDELAIKTGAGGLMDAEFLAQTFCLAHGWQEANTLKALLRARDEGVLARKDADELIENYRRLRRVEGILRRWSYEGETVLPDEPEPYYRVSVRCGFATPEDFRSALAEWRKAIRAVYTKVFAGKI